MSAVEIDPEEKVYRKLVVITTLAFAAGVAFAGFIAFVQYELGFGALEVGFGLLASAIVVAGGAKLFERRAPEVIKLGAE